MPPGNFISLNLSSALIDKFDYTLSNIILASIKRECNKAEARTKSRSQNPEVRSQKKRKSKICQSGLRLIILDSEF